MAHGYGYRSEQRLRKENQDTFGVFECNGFQLIVVCDGMGGHVGGRQASSIAVRTIHDELKDYTGGDVRGALRRAIEAANRAIYEMARKNYRLMGMGTTCVAAAISGNAAHIAHVGDSRGYLIRDGNIRALTRDHTMVNLFVDAELLSPEDAATHPEAHVLSRSLGVERQVEVELQEPLPVQTGDRILLCSDGVHGVIGTSGLGNVDWRNPQEGVDAALAAVERAAGDDNATLAVFGLGISGTSSPPTEPPDLASLEEEARQAPAQVPLQPVNRPTLIPNAGATAADEDVMPVEDLDPATSIGDAPGGIPTGSRKKAGKKETPVKATKAKGGKRSGGSRALVFGLGALAAVATVVAVVTWSGGDGTTKRTAPKPAVTAAPADAATAQPKVAPDYVPSPEDALLAGSGTRGMFRGRCLDCTSSFAAPSTAAYLSGSDDPEVAVAFFAPEIPPSPRRVPNTTSVYDHPPPSGPDQTKAVRAARNKRCREALDTVRDAIRKSIDYASLYGAAWYCFNDTHTNALARARAATFSEFEPLIPHFEGDRHLPASAFDGSITEAVGDAAADVVASVQATLDNATAAIQAEDAPDNAGGAATEDETVAATTLEQLETGPVSPYAHLPDVPDTWSIAAAGGIEYRLALFEIDGDVQGFRDIMTDLLGEPTVADHLAADILLEATAAAAVARMEHPTTAALQAWARRVYVASRAMTGPVGELVRAHRPEVAGLIEALLFEATGGDDGLVAIEEGYANDAVPPVVARAQAAGLTGQMPDMFGVAGGGDLLLELAEAQRTGEVASRGANDRQPRRGNYSRSRRSGVRPDTLRNPSDFDWDAFGYLKVWYPRQRVARVLMPYQTDGVAEPPAPKRSNEGVEVFRKDNTETLDADWE